MKAKFTTTDCMNARQPDNKETVDSWNVVVMYKNELIQPITARFYMGRSSSASVVYCCFWAHNYHHKTKPAKSVSVSGKGTASGWGYHKMSAALASAISDAGIKLFGSPYAGQDEGYPKNNPVHFGGCGSSSMEEALKAITKALGYHGKMVIVKQ